MRTAKLASAVGISALLLCSFAASSGAQERARQRAPIVRVYSQNGPDVLGTTSYVEPAIEVSENAYVFAVSMDLDGHIQVLHPDFPGLSVRIVAHRELRLPNFFTGFARPTPLNGMYSSAANLGYYDYRDGYNDSRGTVIALASRAPFNLELIESGGDWNISAIRQLIENRSPLQAAQALASYVGQKGEPIGRDFMRFAGRRNYYYAYDPYLYDPCGSYYGYGFGALRQAQIYSYLNYLSQHGQRVRFLGYDLCGLPIVVPVNSAPPAAIGHFPVPRLPRNPGDTTVFPKSRAPREGVPRPPRSALMGAPERVFPLTQRTGLPQMDDATITAARGCRGEPRQIFYRYRTQPIRIPLPAGRVPSARTIPSTESAAASGGQPVREFRPEPRVESPPPARVPDRPRESPPPAPVVHERPSSPPPPPPPRVEAPTTRTEPARVPPPNRRQ